MAADLGLSDRDDSHWINKGPLVKGRMRKVSKEELLNPRC